MDLVHRCRLVFHPDSLRRALYYAQVTNAEHLVLFPTALVETWGERMMISFTQVTAGLALRAWKVPDPNAREFIGVGAFNLITRAAYNQIGTFSSLRMAVVDDLQLGQVVKQAGLRQDVVFGPNLVSLRWAQGALGVVHNLEKNLFAFFDFRMSLGVPRLLCHLPLLRLAVCWAGLRARLVASAIRPGHGDDRASTFSY